MKRQALSKKTRFEVFKRDSFSCQYCGASAPSAVLRVDHIHPVSKDGDNDILNLITACFDCNAGKSDRLLSDDSVILKQKAQLDELQERREQLEMLVNWRDAIKGIGDAELDTVLDALDVLTPDFNVNETGKQSLRKLLAKFGVNAVLDAVEVSRSYLKYFDNALTEESVNEAFGKLGGICRIKSRPDWKRELYYIRGILRKRLSYCNEYQAMQYLEQAYEDGTSLEDLKDMACTARNWTQWTDSVNDR